MLAVTPYYEPEGGGLERYAHAILRRLAARGHEVRALAFTTQPTAGAELLDGVRVARLRPRWRVSNTPVDPGFGARVRAALREFRPDVLVAHCPVPFPAEAAARAARREGVPYVVTYHAGRLEGGTPLLDALAWLDRNTAHKAMVDHAARLIAVGPFVRDHALARWKHNVDLVPPGVDSDVFVPNGDAKGHDVLFVGPLDHAYRWKGLDVLWEAMSQVRREVPDARLVLVGDGDRRAELEAKAASGAASFRGRLPLPDLVRAYQDSAVTTLPSTRDAESFGMVLAEANACARPVVASRVGGIPDFVRDGDNGLLAAPGDPRDLAARLVEVLQDQGRAAKMGEAGRARVVREHDWDALTERTERVLERAL